tara:strand:+ start:9330 stop:10109 length:780 start_codon:yes stop_codon:yes gene_type:complete
MRHYALTRIICIAALILMTGCASQGERTQPPPEGASIVNAQLEEIREKNFSVLRTEMVVLGMSMDNPMLIRAFKNEMQLELWVKSSYHNQYELFKTYNICNKSGVLGPKLKEGDLQTPEGYYSVTQDRLNPNSNYFLSFNIGYPNAYDRAHKRTGSLLMIHGSCVSEGCLAMTDKSIAEIYLIVEQNFKYGHKSIPIEIFPFRMSKENMNLRRLSRWYPFWKNLKQGYDYFEYYHVPPEVSVHNQRYVFGRDVDYAAMQ